MLAALHSDRFKTMEPDYCINNVIDCGLSVIRENCPISCNIFPNACT
jgi:hypothetical protein